MKIQCSCGAKYEFEVSLEMAQRPVRFICPACGLDSSEFVSGLVRQELGESAGGGKQAVKVTATSLMQQDAGAYALRTQAGERTAQAEVQLEAATFSSACSKHPGETAMEKCVVCSKPICPKCMELFGCVCSPLCRSRAVAQGLTVPIFKGQKSVREARRWRLLSRVAWTATILVVVGLGFWFWYAWFGSAPKSIFSVRFADVAYSGQSRLSGTDQVVFLHGGTLARYDLKTKSQIWSRELLDKKQIAQAIDQQMKRAKAAIDHANNVNPENTLRMPAPDKLATSMERQAASELDLRVYGKNIWVSSPGKLVRYDWAGGTPAQEITFDSNFGVTGRGEEMLCLTEGSPSPTIRRINLVTGESRTEQFGAPNVVAEAPGKGGTGAGKPKNSAPSGGQTAPMAGLPVGLSGKDGGRPMDPAKVAEQAQHLPLAARIALPAVLAGNLNQERTMAELNDSSSGAGRTGAPAKRSFDTSTLIPTQDGFVQFSSKLLEEHLVTHTAMKAQPAKSALEGAVTVSKSTEVANEILNDMQRSRGGDVVTEDQSRYLVTMARQDGKDVWSGEVVGPPKLFPLHTKRVLSAGKTLVMFDESNRKLWQSTLNYNLTGEPSGFGLEAAPYGEGPCVEHKDGLYVFDQGVLTAFDIVTGNVRWRLPSVGVAGLFFDDRDMLYVNTTTASPEKIKYSRQIDLSQKATSIVLKIDSRSGKVLWTAEPGGLVTHVSGKYVFTVQSYRPDEEEDNTYVPDTGFETPPYLRIKRINTRNGRAMWEHFQQRAPLDVQFEQNSIELVFKKEVQVLRFLAL